MTKNEQLAPAPMSRSVRPRVRAVWVLWTPVVAGLLIIGTLRAIDAQSIGWLNNLLLVFSGLLIEAVPFILLGATVSSVIEVYVSPDRFARFAHAPRTVQIVAASFGGLLFPVCECGSVPVTRRLMARGLNPAAAITFMLAAPIVNPVVILSTWFAFRGRDIEGLMVGGRIGLGLAVAILTGLIMARWLSGVGSASTLKPSSPADEKSHDHNHDTRTSSRPRLRSLVEHTGSEFVGLMKYMLLGAAIAALLQTVIPQNSIDAVASVALLAIPAMMLFAFVLSLCSESDAILIASFAQFSPAAQLAFLVFGPMLDTKLAALYFGTFGPRIARRLCLTVALTALVLCLWLQAVLFMFF